METAVDDRCALLPGVHAVQHGQSQHEHSHPAHVAAVPLGLTDHRHRAVILLLVPSNPNPTLLLTVAQTMDKRKCFNPQS